MGQTLSLYCDAMSLRRNVVSIAKKLYVQMWRFQMSKCLQTKFEQTLFLHERDYSSLVNVSAASESVVRQTEKKAMGCKNLRSGVAPAL